MMNRRQFNKSLLAFSAFSAIGAAGCPSLVSIETELNDWVPLGLDAFDGVLALFDPPLAALLAPESSLVIDGLNAIESGIAAWQAADATQKPGLLGGVIAGIQTAETSIGNFLAAVGVKAPALLGPAKALANIILGILQNFANRLGGSPATAAATVSVKGGAIQIEPLNLSQSQFCKKFDTKASDLGHPEARGKWGWHKKHKK